jgi:type I restriction enzyme S subunit
MDEGSAEVKTWSRTRLDRVATVNARIGWKALTAQEYQADGYAFLATPNIKSEVIDFENVNYISEYRYQESPELKLQPGDVLLAKDGTLGIANVVRSLPRPATVNGSIAVLRAFAMEPRYLMYVIRGNPIQEWIGQVKDGMGVPHLFQADIKKFALPRPPDGEQRRIADFLDDQVARIDKVIAGRRAQIDSLRAVVQALVAHELSTVQHQCGAVPLRRFVSVVITGSTPPPAADDPAGIPWFSPASIRADGSVGSPVRRIAASATRADGFVRFPANSVLLVGIGATAGRVARLHMAASGNQQLTCICPTTQLDVDFLYRQLQARSQELLATAPFTTLPIINNDVIKRFLLVVPDHYVQTQLVANWERDAKRVAVQVGVLDRSVGLLEELKRSLITAVVTGELDVSSADGSRVPV